MSSESTGSEILDQYRNTSNKLKKRFLRKPNVTEACESFTSLGQHCENAELPQYAGMCWIAAAQCEGSLGNIPGETSCLVRSARQFMAAEIKDESLGCTTPSSENLQAALNCYSHASSRFPKHCPLTVGLNLEIVEALKRLNKDVSTEAYLKKAIELSQNSLNTKLHCLELLASTYIERGEYTSALDTFTEITVLLENTPINGAQSDVLLRCEINRVLLVLILRPAPQKLAPSLAKLLEKYTWGDKNDRSLKACGMTEKLFILMQSLVMICQSLDVSNLPDIEGQMWPYFSCEQKDLLRVLVRIYLYT